MQTYAELIIGLEPHAQEMWIAWLYELGFENFSEEEHQLGAFIEKEKWGGELQAEAEERLNKEGLEWSVRFHDPTDWNAVWESNFEPILIDGELFVRAAFHEPRPDIPMEILIAPRMAFGTGHHATTSMILRHMLQQDLRGLRVLDFGCGTGILGICAAKKDCALLDMIDIEEASVENAAEHCAMNHVTARHILQGSREAIPDQTYDLILANITRNVLEECLPDLCSHLAPGGHLVISGFLEQDKDFMIRLLEDLGLKTEQVMKELDWLAIYAKAPAPLRNA